MEHTNRLLELTKEYAKLIATADQAKDIAGADKLKTEALKYWTELQRELNRAYREMQNITRTTRARVVQEGYARTKQWVEEVTKEETQTVNTEPARVAEAPAPKKKAKKSKK